MSSGSVPTGLRRVQQALASKGAKGIVGLGRKFKIMDDDGSKTLNEREFRKAMKELGVMLGDLEVGHLFDYFDKDGSGSLSVDEFLVGLRGELNERRRGMVRLAFDKLDKTGDGLVKVEDLADVYNAKKHPDVIAGTVTEAEVLRGFLDTFDVGDHDGTVTPEEFEHYYGGVSASIDDDDYFELMIRNAWHISGGEGWCANTTNKRVLKIDKDGNETVEEVKEDRGGRGGGGSRRARVPQTDEEKASSAKDMCECSDPIRRRSGG